jgi:chromosome segregation ATPase
MGKEKGTSMPETPSTDTPTGPSLVNVIMVYLSILGLGVIGGYGVFFYTFSERCINLLEETQVRFNTSHEEWETKYKEALAEKEQCIIPLNEMQGRLEAQSALAERHQALLAKQKDTVAKLSALQQFKEESSAALETLKISHRDLILKQEDTLTKLEDSNDALEKLRTQMRELQLELDRAYQKVTDSAQEKERAEKELQDQKRRADKSWVKQEEEINALKRSQQDFDKLRSQVERAEKDKEDSDSNLEKFRTQVGELQLELERAKQQAENPPQAENPQAASYE